MMMRHLAAVGETYAQTALEDAAWNLWPVNPSQASTSTSSSNNPNPSTSTVRHRGGHSTGAGGGSLIRTTPPPPVPDVGLSNIIAMDKNGESISGGLSEGEKWHDISNGAKWIW